MNPVFVDTNVFVYRYDSSEPAKQARAREWLSVLWRQRAGRLSQQVLQELYVRLAHELRPGMAPPEARSLVRDLAVWNPVASDARLTERAWQMEDRHGVSWRDALVMSAAQVAGCGFLLSEELQDGLVFGSVEVVDPFRLPGTHPRAVMASRRAEP